ncbi:Lethal(2) giant larvae 1 [Araneus ventricosus]|uniref:Lethal(2) giant larvae 1 n=1 Tax=Araneus ventricosus TaxID=182803 RepID=A0A4Y2AR88_ARAVE|nr:Lethal(2) giant larvae 1 [Araneus ventricosus]
MSLNKKSYIGVLQFARYCGKEVEGKEIQLKHRAPVIAIEILDGSGHPLPEPFEVENNRAKSPDLSGNHRVIICSEEQFKVRAVF